MQAVSWSGQVTPAPTVAGVLLQVLITQGRRHFLQLESIIYRYSETHRRCRHGRTGAIICMISAQWLHASTTRYQEECMFCATGGAEQNNVFRLCIQARCDPGACAFSIKLADIDWQHGQVFVPAAVALSWRAACRGPLRNLRIVCDLNWTADVQFKALLMREEDPQKSDPTTAAEGTPLSSQPGSRWYLQAAADQLPRELQQAFAHAAASGGATRISAARCRPDSKGLQDTVRLNLSPPEQLSLPSQQPTAEQAAAPSAVATAQLAAAPVAAAARAATQAAEVAPGAVQAGGASPAAIALALLAAANAAATRLPAAETQPETTAAGQHMVAIPLHPAAAAQSTRSAAGKEQPTAAIWRQPQAPAPQQPAPCSASRPADSRPDGDRSADAAVTMTPKQLRKRASSSGAAGQGRAQKRPAWLAAAPEADPVASSDSAWRDQLDTHDPYPAFQVACCSVLRRCAVTTELH